jgi:iron complex outermembrane receptor protein
MRFLILILFISAFGGNLLAQSVISGKITDKATSEAMIQATIGVKGGSEGTVTDLDGNYTFTLAAGKYTIEVRYVGYQNIEKIIEVDGINPVQLDFEMTGELVSDVVIVTEGKYEKKLEESTVSVDVVRADQIQRNNVRSLDDVISKVSGVQIMDGQVSIRGGAGYAYGAGSRVSLLIDGQILLSAELSDMKFNFVPMENVEQIEVIKGSASVLYGSGALNGVINVRTAYPTLKPYTSFTTYAGIYDNPPVDSMRWLDPKKEPYEQPMFTGIYFAHREKLYKNFDLVIGGNIHLENGYIKTIDERRFRFNVNTRYVHPKMDGRLSFGVNSNVMYYEVGTFFLAQNMRNNAYRNVSEGGRDRYFSTTIDPYITYYDPWKNRHDLRGRWYLISMPRDPFSSDGHLFSTEYQFQRDFKNNWKLNLGTQFQHFFTQSILFDDNVTAPGEDDRGTFSGNSIAFYGQLEKKFFDRLNIVVGMRWEGFFIGGKFLPINYPLPRIGLNYSASKNDFIRASFGTGFRFPSFAERFINERIPVSALDISVFPNPDVKPETGWSAELAYRRTFKTNSFKMYADFAMFWMEYQNMVEFSLGFYNEVPGVHPAGLGFKSLNVSQARIAGFELSTQAEGYIGKFPVRVWGGYTFSFPGDLEGDTTQRNVGIYLQNMFSAFANGINPDSANIYTRVLRYRSLHTVRLDVETEFKGFTLGMAANFTSHVHKIDFILDVASPGVNNFRKIHNKGFTIFDLRIGYRFNERQNINFIINNLLNTEYAIRPARMGAPRTFSIKYTHIF